MMVCMSAARGECRLRAMAAKNCASDGYTQCPVAEVCGSLADSALGAAAGAPATGGANEEVEEEEELPPMPKLRGMLETWRVVPREVGRADGDDARAALMEVESHEAGRDARGAGREVGVQVDGSGPVVGGGEGGPAPDTVFRLCCSQASRDLWSTGQTAPAADSDGMETKEQVDLLRGGGSVIVTPPPPPRPCCLDPGNFFYPGDCLAPRV